MAENVLHRRGGPVARASVYIRSRKTKSRERRHIVCYRLGGRAYPERTAGTFRTERDAKARARLVEGEIAAGRNPDDTLRELETDSPVRSLKQVADVWLKSRVDLTTGAAG